ncbi:uncharacterized protein K460DRAFT_369279 [Cucurbitaria berberidis CBS 394.84]|uniref:Uncharacterized protein n=1 Tax=Cucurbitaria berberidis CBS 394.84 TaxID=1168544 RepID=A0A9P4GFV9_9PLEO|nr:uncharacterized protein K460DRAFT_369279 [Cucurbitaria berberidis CBS 394.84]KAF1844420.1 hypothetical protein K460DRAFT_369279 [Cucurbitaria berberidis CBS 394.84]
MSFRATAAKLIRYVGRVKLEDLPASWQSPVNNVLEAKETENPNVAQANIKGSHPHKSHKDPSDPKDVISVQLLDAAGSRIESIHIHEDGTSKSK